MRLWFLLAVYAIGSAIHPYNEMLGVLKQKGLTQVENYVDQLSKGGWIGRIKLYLDSYVNGSKRGQNIELLVETISDDMAKGLPFSQNLALIKSFPKNNGLGISTQMLDAYLCRIDYKLKGETFTPTRKVLDELLLHHSSNIPVESTRMTLLNSNISLDINAIFQQLVYQRRGGYCYQRNLLLAAVLSKLGFDVRLGRSWMATWNEDGSYKFEPEPNHAILFVHGLDDNILLADTTIWASYTNSIPIYDGATVVNNYGVSSTIRGSDTDNSLFELVEDGRLKHVFTTDEFKVEDYLSDKESVRNDANHILNRHLIFKKMTPEGMTLVLDNKITTMIDGVRQEQEIRSMEEMQELLANLFGIILTKQEIPLVKQRLFHYKNK